MDPQGSCSCSAPSRWSVVHLHHWSVVHLHRNKKRLFQKSGLKRGMFLGSLKVVTWKYEGQGFRERGLKERGALSSGFNSYGNRKERVQEKKVFLTLSLPKHLYRW